MAHTIGSSISACNGLTVPISSAWDALAAILREYEEHPGTARLSLDLTELRIPLEGVLSVPIALEAGGSVGGSKYEARVTIGAATKRDVFPHFDGVLELVAEPGYKCQLRLDGNYTVPFHTFGKVVDETLLRGVAAKSLQDFVDALAREVTERVKHDEVDYARHARGL